jgi:PAS domain S-box-containing protein
MIWTVVAQQAGIIAGAVVSVLGAIKYIWKPLKGKYKKAVAFYDTCSYLSKEVKPNGGSSMKDSVDGLKLSIDAVLATVVRLDQRQISFAHQSDKGIFESDLNGDCIFVNRAYCRITGRSPDEAFGKGWKAFIAPEDREAVVDEWYDCVKERRDFIMTYSYIRPDLTRVKVNCHAYVLRDVRGLTIGYMGFVVPISSTDPGNLL